jgi:hypothetical protein
MRNTADVTGRKHIAVLLQSISVVSAIIPLVAFYDIHGGKKEVLFFYFVPDTTRDVTVKYSQFITIAIWRRMNVENPIDLVLIDQQSVHRKEKSPSDGHCEKRWTTICVSTIFDREPHSDPTY